MCVFIITFGIVLRYAGIDRLRRVYPGPESYCGQRDARPLTLMNRSE
jgi:hypothetical protein